MPNVLDGFNPPSVHMPADCPFCPIEDDYTSPDSVVSDGNDSGTLGGNLEATGDNDGKESFHVDKIYQQTGGIHGQYTVQAHHLICGNEILGEQAEVQSYLCKEGRHDGKLQPCDTGYDVNSAKNGIWLPSTPAMYKQKISVETVLKKEADAGVESSAPRAHLANHFKDFYSEFVSVFGAQLKELGLDTEQPWTDMVDDEQDDIAAVVMVKYKRQFHLGQHDVIDKAEESYVKRGIKHLDSITLYMDHYANECPMDKGNKKKEPPYKPPFKLNAYLDTLSDQMRDYVTGDPEDWEYFISKWAKRLTDKLNS